MTHIVNESNFEELVLKSEVPVLLTFGAEWCGPCKALQPLFESVAHDFQQRILVGKVDVEKSPNIQTQLDVRTFPTTLIISKGIVQQKITGGLTRNNIIKALEPHLE